MFWMNPTSINNQTIFATGQGGSTAARAYVQLDAAGRINYIVRNGGVNISAAQGPTTLTTNVWTHIAVVQDGTSLKMYYNGASQSVTQSVGTGAEWFSNATAQDRWTIGNLISNGVVAGSYYAGRLDDVRYYSNTTTSITASVVSSIRDAGVAGYYGLGSPNITVPTAAHTDDPNTLLLLPFDTTTQGNDLLDISANGAGRFATSVNGAGVTGKFGNAFVSFDGTGDYLSVADAASLDFGTGTFSGDLWFRKGVTGTQMMLLNKRDGAANNEINLINQASDLLSFATYNSSGGGANVIANSATGLAVDNDWHHIYFQRNSGDLALYLDGTQIAFAAGASEDVSSTGDLIYGANDTPAIYFHGDMDGMQISDIVRFSATPVAQPLIQLTCNDNAASTTVLNTGTTSNDATLIGGDNTSVISVAGQVNTALDLDGTADYIRLDTDVAAVADDTQGTFTCWLNADGFGTSPILMGTGHESGIDARAFVILQGGIVRFQVRNANTIITQLDSTSSVPLSTWTHLALVQDGTALVFYFNGVQEAAVVTLGTVSHWFANASSTTQDRLSFGGLRSAASDLNLFDGRMDDIRYYSIPLSQSQIDLIYNSGTGSENIAPDTITVPTTEAVADANSVLLLNCNTLDLADNKHIVEFEGGMAINTNFAPLSDLRGSLSLNGTNQYVSAPTSSNWDVSGDNTTDYTVDLWVKFLDITGESYLVGQFETAANRWSIFKNTSGIRYNSNQGGANTINTGLNGDLITDTNWHHIALSKVANTTDSDYGLYFDGTQVGFDNSSATDTFVGSLYIGTLDGVTGFRQQNISEVRITNNNAFNATPIPLAELHLDMNDNVATNVVLDIGSAGINGTSVGDTTDNLSAVGQINTALEFNGSSEYVTIDSFGANVDGDNVGTFACWVYPTAITTNTVFSGGVSGGDHWLALQLEAGGFRFFGQNSSITIIDVDSNAGALSLNTWYHIAVVQDATAVKLYQDGVDVTGTINTGGTQWFNDLTSTVDRFTVGALRRNGTTNTHFAGRIDDVRYYPEVLPLAQIGNIYNGGTGTEAQESSITIPTTKHTAGANTLLLLHLEPGITAGVPVDLLDSSSSGHVLSDGGGNGAHVTGAFNEGSTPGYATFDGTQNIKIAGHSDFEWLEDPKQDETIHFWVRHESDPTGTGQQYFYYANVAATLRFILQHSSSNVTRLVINTQNGGTQLIDGLAISDTLWHHIAIIGIGNEGDSGSGQSTGKSWQGYLDGTQILQGFQNGHDVATIDDDLYIGSNRTGGTFFTGDMDAFIVQHDNTIFNASYALTGDSITVPIAEPAGITTPGIMTLQSVTTTALASPDTIKIYFDLEDLDPTVVLNTDIIVGVQRNTTDAFLQIATLTFSVTGGTHPRHIIEATVDMTVDQGSGVPAAGTDIYYQVQTANDRQLRLHSVTMLWD
jgi:hypothetical protein